MATETKNVKASSRAATDDEVKVLSSMQSDEPDAEVWGRIPTGKNFYVAEKCYGRTLQGHLIGAEMNAMDTEKPFLTYIVRTTDPILLTSISGEDAKIGADENVSIVATSGLKGELRDFAMNPENVIKVKITALRKRDIGKNAQGIPRKYIDYSVEFVQVSATDKTPRLYPRSSIRFAGLTAGTAEAAQLTDGA